MLSIIFRIGMKSIVELNVVQRKSMRKGYPYEIYLKVGNLLSGKRRLIGDDNGPSLGLDSLIWIVHGLEIDDPNIGFLGDGFTVH